jgi:hypothetical protein
MATAATTEAGQTARGNITMGWEKGRYYTRSRKVNGRVVREYVGTGDVAEQAAMIDAIARQGREARRAARAELTALDAPLDDLAEQTDLLARAALAAAGYRQHHRGEWRKRRGNSENPRRG